MEQPLFKYLRENSYFLNLLYFSQITFVVLVFFLQIWFCSTVEAGQNTPRHIKGIRADGHVEFKNSAGETLASISVEVAATPETRGTGLMWRTELDDTMGMLFIFEEVDRVAFWMGNTPTPLDIIFVSEKGQVINIEANTKPMSTTVYRSKGPVKYAVEVNAGFCERFGVTEGTRLRWQRN